MSTKANHYEVLNVRPDASAEQIHSAYRDLCRLYHPDMAPDNPQAHEMMARLNVSYEVLSDPMQRADYDSQLRREQPAQAPAPSAEPSPYFIPPEEEEPRPVAHPRQGSSYETDHSDAMREFIAHFTKRMLIVALAGGVLIYLVVTAGDATDDSGGWLIFRALRRVFFSW